MAPEVVMEKEAGSECDIWSAGVILYFLLAGTRPFEAANRDELIKLISAGQVKFPGNCSKTPTIR
jgi:calcium-dependent protein kinase